MRGWRYKGTLVPQRRDDPVRDAWDPIAEEFAYQDGKLGKSGAIAEENEGGSDYQMEGGEAPMYDGGMFESQKPVNPFDFL